MCTVNDSEVVDRAHEFTLIISWFIFTVQKDTSWLERWYTLWNLCSEGGNVWVANIARPDLHILPEVLVQWVCVWREWLPATYFSSRARNFTLAGNAHSIGCVYWGTILLMCNSDGTCRRCYWPRGQTFYLTWPRSPLQSVCTQTGARSVIALLDATKPSDVTDAGYFVFDSAGPLFLFPLETSSGSSFCFSQDMPSKSCYLRWLSLFQAEHN